MYKMFKEITKEDLNKTVWVRPDYLQKDRKWIEIDATDVVLWKLAEKITRYLMWKDKSYYCDFWDCGDFVVVKNVEKMKITWNKLIQKMYFRYSWYKWNVKSMSLKDMMQKHPERVLYFAVRWMLPKNKLRARRLKRLKIFVWNNDKFDYYKPEKVSV